MWLLDPSKEVDYGGKNSMSASWSISSGLHQGKISSWWIVGAIFTSTTRKETLRFVSFSYLGDIADFSSTSWE